MRRLACLVLIVQIAVAPAYSWGAHGHRTITFLAIDALPTNMPDFLRDPKVRDRIAEQSNEPDRWRGWRQVTLRHVNEPDHYLDVELLADFGLSLETMPRLRQDYMAALRAADPEKQKKDPGLALQAIDENYSKLQASFMTLRILEKLNDSGRAHQLEQARENVIFHMGLLSHFVGDLSQPLHTTKHYNGWDGDNPNGYAPRGQGQTIHEFIDTGVLEHHKIGRETVRPLVVRDVTVHAADPWNDVITYLKRSHAKFEVIYQMEKDGRLRDAAGRELILERLADGASMLSALYRAAYDSAEPTQKQIDDFVRYNEMQTAP